MANTCMDIFAADVPALVVPFLATGEDEQVQRAARLVKAGAVRALDPARLGAENLATEIEATLRFRPGGPRLEFNGAARASEHLISSVRRRIGSAE